MKLNAEGELNGTLEVTLRALLDDTSDSDGQCLIYNLLFVRFELNLTSIYFHINAVSA